MGKPWNTWDWDYLWHLLGGAGITAPFIYTVVAWGWPPWILIPVALTVTILGIAREGQQHDWEPLTAHQWLEGALWGSGSVVTALCGLPFYV